MRPHRTHRRPKCQVCETNEFKYTCSGCKIVYCSVPCFKQHKESGCAAGQSASSSGSQHNTRPETETLLQETPLPILDQDEPEPSLEDPPSLRPLTSLNWPYIPDESAYPDPLKRDDPKTLQLHQYEAIATSTAVRAALAAHPQLPALLTSIDRLRGADREDALVRALGVAPSDIDNTLSGRADFGDDVLAMRALAEAVEAAVRDGREDALGLDWE